MELLLTGLARVSYWALTLYLWMMIIAVLLTWVTPDPRNPIVSFLNRVTMPVWNWVSAALPARLRLFSAYAALLCIVFLIEFLPGALNTLAGYAGGRLSAGMLPMPIAGFALRGIGVVLNEFLYFLIILLLIWFVLTLVSPSVHSPVVRVVYMLVDPIITPLQRVLPRMRVDLSPLIAAGICLLLNIIVVSQLIAFSFSLTQGGAQGLALPQQHM
ncbi:MAG TPA: YggT family protein [bacterium]|nr:YggT family protein [bacterium]